MTYQAKYEAYLAQLNKALEQCCDTHLPQTSEVAQAATYSLMAGGKRTRGILCMAVCDMLGGDMAAATQFACAVEMLHCYSLIHDDLPCMDNDDFRRGKPSCHKVYGESTALLAGDALLTEAFGVVANTNTAALAVASATKALAQGAGTNGMVWGQEIDLKHENIPIDESVLRQIHHYKTGALINAAVQMGASAALASDDNKSQLADYAFDLGLVFQIVDDVLDVTSTQEELGKPIGSDQENGKTTFVTLYGAQAAMELAEKINAEACIRLEQQYHNDADFLISLAQKLLVRKK